ncbi:MAG TPA: trypsin-like peptidase domain-containing protein [Methylomirabilota bacterium]|nr:trypsin-like peptidase domain-containing protein [Methylomirabilota bacterium]
MRRLAIVTVLALVVAAGLVVSGILEVHVTVRPPGSSDAQPFWREARSDGALPPGLGVWIEVARSVTPAVVNISTAQRRGTAPAEEFFRRFFEGPTPQPRASLGSGFIVSADGYVVTNYHVVQQGDEIVVRLADQRELKARLAGGDPRTDIALLKIDASGLPVIAFGDSDQLPVGAPVMAIGNPFGLDQTVTTGIVSAKERYIGAGPYDNFIQTDTSINPGNSGGPLVDVHGALVGINTAIFSQSGGWQGIGFATPVNLAREVLAQLRARGKVTRGYLGVSVMPVTPELAQRSGLDEPRGAVVAEVVQGSPAARAGLRPGDVIVSFQGNPVRSPRDLTRAVAATPPRGKATLEVVGREGRRSTTATLDELPEQPPRR